MAGLKAVFLKKLSMTAYAMGRYAITRRKTRAGAVVPKIHVRRSVVALIAGDSTTPVGGRLGGWVRAPLRFLFPALPRCFPCGATFSFFCAREPPASPSM